MVFEDLTEEEFAFMIGMAALGFGIYGWSGLGILLIIAVLILITAPEPGE